MKIFRTIYCVLFIINALWGQSQLDLLDRHEILFENHILRRTPTKSHYTKVHAFPEIRPSLHFISKMESSWDGSRIYQVGFTEVHRWVVSVGTPFFSQEGQHLWHWSEPKLLNLNTNDIYLLLGAWDESLLFLKIHGENDIKVPSSKEIKSLGYSTGNSTIDRTATDDKAIIKKKPEGPSQSLQRYDLLTREITNVIDVQRSEDVRNTVLFSKDAFYLFMATGIAIRIGVRIEPWEAQKLNSNFWIDTGVTLCKDTREYKNPFIFGRAFLDQDSSILIPTQVLLPLDRKDIDEAWSKLPEARRAELIRLGLWPVPADKEIGWKDDVRFLKFDPSDLKFTQVDRSRFEGLTIEKDSNFIIRRFKDVDPGAIYTSTGGQILHLEAALQNTQKEIPVHPVPTQADVKPPPATKKQVAHSDLPR